MIDLQALKAQLAALGHNLPEDQVISILKDMQLDFTKDGSAPGGTTAAADGLAAGMGAMKLSSAAADLPPRQAARPSAAPAVPSYWLPRRDNAPSVISSRTTHSSCEEDDAVLLSASIEEDPAVRQPPARPAPAAASAFNHDSNSATASLAARLRAITMNNPIAAMQQQQQQQASAVPPAVRSHTPTDFRPAAYGHELDTQHGYGGDQDFGRQPAAGSKAAAVPKIKGWSQGAFAMHRVESPSAAAGDDEYEYDDDTYDEQYDDQYEETALAPGATTRSGASMRYHGQYGSPAAAHCDQYGSHRLPRPASAGSTATGYSTGPRAGSAATTLRRGPGASPAGGLPKKTDRVARYQQMAGQWNKDKFLATGGATSKTPVSRRKNVNFHTLFAALHQHEANSRSKMLKDTRQKTAASLGLGSAPSSAAPSRRQTAVSSAPRSRPMSTASARARPEWQD